VRLSLPSQVLEFVGRHGASTAPEIALALRARRADVDLVLAEGPFQVTETPEGKHGNAKYWISSSVVLSRRGGKSRAARMLDVLRDGRWHSRTEIWTAAGGFFLTNNAAAELRREGRNIVYDKKQDAYRLERAVALRVPRPVSLTGRAA
jgi:hypothetical protein